MRNIKSVLFMAFGILFVVFVLIGPPAVLLGADSYPSRTVRLIIATTPGGSNDAAGRLIAAELSGRLGKQVVVENVGGGGGVIGTEMAARSAPDGYTLLLMGATGTVQAALQKLPYDTMKAFTPVARFGFGTLTLVVHPSVPVKSVKELITLAKQKPGELLFSAGGAGSVGHLNIELFKMMADIDFKIVQFKSAGPSMVDLLGGHSHATIGGIASMLPHIQSGKARVLGTTGDNRHFALPDVPTIAEAGVPGLESSPWYGIVAPTGTPEQIVDRLNKEIKTILASAEVAKRFRDRGVEPGYLGTTEFGRFLGEEIAKWGRVIKKANIKL